jgi:hypothetical protein
LLGVYRWHSSSDNTTFLRFAFTGSVTDHDPDRPLDAGILRAGWFGVEEIREMAYCHRSPLVMRCIDDHLAGKRCSLDVLVHYD